MRIEMPVSIIAGDEDRLIDIDEQLGRLHADVLQSTLHQLPGTGHMADQTATSIVMSAINEVPRDMPSEPSGNARVMSQSISAL
jgi:pimeloyl-ACP methyl ester carboxylesterase